MKTNAIIRIVLYSLAIIILGGILLTALGVWTFSAHFEKGEESQVMLTQEADPSQIRNIEIEWAAGDIRIVPSEAADSIRISESEVEEKYQMVCKTSGDTLKIQSSKSSTNFISLGVDEISKDLVITVPADWFCRELDIDAAAANVTIMNMTIGKLDFDGASGFCTLENCHVTDLDVDAASGDLTFSGSLENLDFDGASADCKLMLTNCPKHIDLDGMSGELDITLPSDCGFTAKTGGLSCDFSTDFQTTSQGSAHQHGDGSCLIELDALSGKVVIHDGGYNCHDGQESHHNDHH